MALQSMQKLGGESVTNEKNTTKSAPRKTGSHKIGSHKIANINRPKNIRQQTATKN